MFGNTRGIGFLILTCARAAVALGQPSTADPVATIEKLFDAMRASDTASTRGALVPTGRVIPIQAGAGTGAGLTVDGFVAFVGRNPHGSWIERIWNPSQRVSGPLADLWFEYDVYKGTTFDHCGANAVQLQQTANGWKIVSMAFTSATQGCASHPPPND